MSLISKSPGETQLAELMDRFEHWRQSRTTRGEPIPDSLWEQAVSLTRLLPLSRVAKRLRLNRQELKKRCGQHQPQQPDTPDRLPVPDFIEVKLEPAGTAVGMDIEVQRPDGSRLQIRYHESQPPLVAVIETFLESR